MLVFSSQITPRLQYTVDFIAAEITTEPWEVTNDPVLFTSSYNSKINYSDKYFDDNILQIPPQGLLFQIDIKPQAINCTSQNGAIVFFQNESDTGFDIFAAVFYLLSRYEEYLPHTKDKYGRYGYENSLAYKEGFLKLPLINIWLENFSNLLTKKFQSFNKKQKQFRLLPTYDIDMAWSYKHKGFLRSAGGFAKQLIQFNFKNAKERIDVLNNKRQDPYYNFEWMDTLHRQCKLHPIYFFLVAEKRSEKDNNTSPYNQAMVQLIKDTVSKFSTGLHPSWQSGDQFSILEKEKTILENIVANPVTISRQHYLRLAFPQTYKKLIAAGIKEDYSMGYGGVNGFRASVASPFYWFDLSENLSTNLKIFPFCFMDATSIYYQNHSPEAALEELGQLLQSVKNVNGFFCTLFHNDTFKDAGWRNVYEKLVQ